ncbi:hypothetical protein MRN18_15480 [bacterium 19MO04SH03]|uniref:Uncharacterized protein n=2 Tax=Unclassified Bacteria TaxID=49928 RepID=A0AAU6V0E8_UNCXX
MDKVIVLIEKYEVLQWALLVILCLIFIMLITFFIQYNIDRSKGRHAKFLWFEVNAGHDRITEPETQEQSSKNIRDSISTGSVSGKNVNNGTNFGEIGDKYTGLKQRDITRDDIVYLENEIKSFMDKYADRINSNHITIGFPGCKETTNLVHLLIPVLNSFGFKNIQCMNLQTFGVVGKKFGVSNAPDNSLMVEVFPADNVE